LTLGNCQCSHTRDNVRFTRNSGHLQRTSRCPLSAKSGHRFRRQSPNEISRVSPKITVAQMNAGVTRMIRRLPTACLDLAQIAAQIDAAPDRTLAGTIRAWSGFTDHETNV
ncbi:MAG: hypothetical protein WBD15_12805, partial [Pseudolabrys sp.]